MDIAVIGSGISGLTVGWLLSRKEGTKITIFDKTPSSGLDVHALDIPPNDPKLNNSQHIHIDLPFRMHTPSYYFNFVALLKELGVETEDYYQDIALCNNKGEPVVSYKTVKIGTLSIPWINLKSLGYWWEFVSFKWKAKRDLASGKMDGKTLWQYLTEIGCSQSFIFDFLFNYFSLVCTCSYETLKEYPVEPLAKFVLAISSGVSLRQFKYGTKDVALRLEKPLCKRYNTCVNGLKLMGSKIALCLEDGKEELYDHVIISTEPTVAYNLVKDIPELKRQANALSKFPVEKSSISIHTDSSVLPCGSNSPKNTMISRSNTTEVHNILQQSYKSVEDVKFNLIQTWSTTCPAKPATIYREAVMNRVVLTLDSMSAGEVLVETQGQNNIWFCGAYVNNSLPLLEGGVSSALKIAKEFGVSTPWNSSKTSSFLFFQILFGIVILILSGVCVF